ncbi:MAG: FliO/MopB family protein [bacterium]
MKLKLFLPLLFLSALFIAIFSNISLADSADGNLSLKNLYVSKSKNSNSYLIWFKFNQKPKSIVKKLGLKGYSLELAFKNAKSDLNSKFIKFHDNKLFKAAEIIPLKNSELNVIIYFHKNIKINKKNTFATFYGNYFIIKINHTFSGDLFKNVGKESLLQKNKIKQAVKTVKSATPSAAASVSTSASAAAGTGASSTGGIKTSSFLSKSAPKLNMGFEAVKTTVYLALIIGLIYGVYFLMNKFKNRVSVKEKLNNLKIVSSINLGNKKSILLIEVNKEFFLVGVSQSNIQVIGHLKSAAGNINAKDALYKVAADADAAAGINADETNTYAEAAFVSPSPAIKSYGKFADAMREEVNNGGDPNEPYRKITAERYSDANKVKNINEAKFKNKADNVFFDIEERLKGLMESNGNSKKF